MPIYEYLCTDGHRVELVQRFSDEALTTCEMCGKPARRVLHAPAVHFKGKGFYATDYGKRTGTNGDKADSGSPSESGSKEAAASSSSDGNSSSKSESKGSDSKSSDSKSSDSKGSDSKGSGGEGSSSSAKADSKPAA